MRAIRTFLLGILVFGVLVPVASAEHFEANCPLSFVGSTQAASPFFLSPHGVFRNGSQIFLLRGQTLTTLNITELGDVQVAREDFIGAMASHDPEGGTAYANGFLYVSGEAGLEIFDLRNVRGGVGGSAPVLISRTPGLHYRRLAINGSILAGVYPATDYPCFVNGTAGCFNTIDIISVANLTAPTRISQISSRVSTFVGWNDVAWANGFLYGTGFGGTYAFDMMNPESPVRVLSNPTVGTFLETNGTNILAIGQETAIGIFGVGPRFQLASFGAVTVPSIFDRSNNIVFHNQAYIDDVKLVTLIDEKDPSTGRPARTVAFDVFDFTVPFLPGADDRIFENVSYITPDEVKFDPIAVGPFVYVVGEVSGTQTYGACDNMAGDIEFDSARNLPCGGAEVHGWVTGKQKITTVELFLDSRSLGFATLTNERTDIVSPSAVRGWRINLNLDNETRGLKNLRAVGTDILGRRRQFSSEQIFFNGPGQNCSSRSRSVRR